MNESTLKQILARVISSSEVMPGVYLLWLEAPEIASAAKPGQFVMVHCGEETFLRRPLSIHQVDNKTKTKLALLFAVKGKGTQWLSQRQAGDNVDLLGPLGNGFSIYPESSNLLLVAGGIGIAPLRFLADEAVKQAKKVTLLMGAGSAVHLLPTAASSRGLLTEGVLPRINIKKTTEDGTAGKKGMITDLLPGFVDRADQIFACGPVGMYRAIATSCERFPKLKSVQISLEVMMGCGLGFCYGCTVRTKNGLKQVCQDGPVFDLSDILWDEINCF